MSICNAMGAIVLAAALALPAIASAFDESKYPDMQAQWSRPPGTGIQWDPSKPGRPAAGAAADARISGHMGGQHGGPGERRPGQ